MEETIQLNLITASNQDILNKLRRTILSSNATEDEIQEMMMYLNLMVLD